MDPVRARRVSETMREELSEIIRFELADPRVSGVDVTDVHLSKDLRRADVVVALPSDPDQRPQALEGLESAGPFLRRQLMQRIDIYRMPDLRFVASEIGASGVPTGKLMRRVRRGRPRQGTEKPLE